MNQPWLLNRGVCWEMERGRVRLKQGIEFISELWCDGGP